MISELTTTAGGMEDPSLPWNRYKRPKTDLECAHARKVPLSRCEIRRDGDFILVLQGELLLNWENVARGPHGYDWLSQALDLLAPGREPGSYVWPLAPLAAWKTAGMLATLRQALRENFAQGMGLEDLKPGVGERPLRAWLARARAHDTVHHGQATF